MGSNILITTKYISSKDIHVPLEMDACTQDFLPQPHSHVKMVAAHRYTAWSLKHELCIAYQDHQICNSVAVPPYQL